MKNLIILLIFVLFNTSLQARESTKESYSYVQQDAWKQLQQHLPVEYRLNSTNSPKEYFFDWNKYNVHVDHYPMPSASAKVILLHGVGTNGRQMTLILGHPLAQAGFETFALDLPGYGLTKYPAKKDIRYDEWVEIVNAFVNREAAKDQRPIYLYGLSAGGMLALHVSSMNKHVKGVIGMTFLDQRVTEVQKGTMRFSFLQSLTNPLMELGAKTPIGNINLPLSLVSKMNQLTNDPQALSIMLDDKTSAGNAMPINFLRSYVHYQPRSPLSSLNIPILLTQPEDDRWTPLQLSEPVLKQLTTPYKVVILPKGGHYPVEKEALNVLKENVIQFIQAH